MTKFLAIVCGALLTVAAAGAAESAPAQWEAGKNYFLIDPAQPTSTGDKIEVLEIFSYACPHCAHFQPYAEQLRKSLPAYASFQSMPAVFNASWEPFARAFYAAQSLGVLAQTHQAMFDALHVERLPLRSIDDMASFYAQHGVDRGKFLSAANSFEVESKLARSRQMVTAYHIDGTPSVVVQGKYRVTGASAGSYENLIALVDWLVAKEHADAAKATK